MTTEGLLSEEDRELWEAGRVLGALVVLLIRGGERVDDLVLSTADTGGLASNNLRRLSTVFLATTPSEDEDDSFSSSVGGVIRLMSGGGCDGGLVGAGKAVLSAAGLVDVCLSTEEARRATEWTDGLEFRFLPIPAAARWMKDDTKDEGADTGAASLASFRGGTLSELFIDAGSNKLLVDAEALVLAAREESMLYA